MGDLVKTGGSGLVGLLHGKTEKFQFRSLLKKIYFFLILM